MSQADKPTVEELAQTLDDLLNGLRVSCSTFLFYFKQGKDAPTVAERIHFQTGALDMLDDVADYLPAVTDTSKKLKFSLLRIQEILTEKATSENTKGE